MTPGDLGVSRLIVSYESWLLELPFQGSGHEFQGEGYLGVLSVLQVMLLAIEF